MTILPWNETFSLHFFHTFLLVSRSPSLLMIWKIRGTKQQQKYFTLFLLNTQRKSETLTFEQKSFKPFFVVVVCFVKIFVGFLSSFFRTPKKSSILKQRTDKDKKENKNKKKLIVRVCTSELACCRHGPSSSQSKRYLSNEEGKKEGNEQKKQAKKN